MAKSTKQNQKKNKELKVARYIVLKSDREEFKLNQKNNKCQ